MLELEEARPGSKRASAPLKTHRTVRLSERLPTIDCLDGMNRLGQYTETSVTVFTVRSKRINKVKSRVLRFVQKKYSTTYPSRVK